MTEIAMTVHRMDGLPGPAENIATCVITPGGQRLLPPVSDDLYAPGATPLAPIEGV